jgi:hypothetical protein
MDFGSALHSANKLAQGQFLKAVGVHSGLVQ